MHLNVIVLAAGKGKRMASNLPKVMHTLGGIPLLERVINTAKQLQPQHIHVVYGNGGGRVRDSFQHLQVEWIDQKEQLGTGHAVRQALPFLTDDTRVLVLYGDVPLVSVDTLQKLLNQTGEDEVGVLVAHVKDPTGLGRILRDKEGKIIEIVEHRDASDEQRCLQEINTGIIVCNSTLLKKWLPHLKSHNEQGEFYLTDIIAFAVQASIRVHGCSANSEFEIQGVNDLWQLTTLERAFQREHAKKLALSGVRIMDPERLDIRSDTIEIASDVTLDVNVILEGKVTIGKNSTVGANCLLKDVDIGENVTILPNTIIEGAEIANGAAVGPFSRIRKGCILEKNSKVGNFVEMKKTILGSGSKASHLTYLGDALIEANVNIGAGTITCNYDGVNKWSTVIKSGAFVGSNTSLVAPVTIGTNATVGAGSTITMNVPDSQLTIARSRQIVVPDWERPRKESVTKNNEAIQE